MGKKFLCATLMILLINCAAVAEMYQGSTVASSSVRIEAENDLSEINVSVGQRVEAGDVLAVAKSTRVFAQQDGIVASIGAEVGEKVDGTVVEIAPESKYRIYCTVEDAKQTPENMLIHSGEALYIRCTADGTHRATGVVTQIDGSEYQLLTTGGELYVGETVYLYRDEEFSADQRVGIGTVVVDETCVYQSQGTISKICVEEGEYVERGELLYEVISGTEFEILATVDGIVTQIPDSETEEEGAAAFMLVPDKAICVEVKLDETQVYALSAGDDVGLIYADDVEGNLWPGTVIQIAKTEVDGKYTAYIAPQTGPERLGLTVQVYFGEI